MPSARLKLQTDSNRHAEGLPEILRTPSGTVMLEVQGIINVGESPLTKTELDLGSETAEQRDEVIRIGEIDLSQIDESGAPVKLYIGESQLLRGQVTKMKTPLALLDVSQVAADSDIPVVDVITHKIVFSSRPEPVLSRST